MSEGKNLIGVDIGSSSIKVCEIKEGRKGARSLVRFGFHVQPSALVLSFSGALDESGAEDVRNYRLVPLVLLTHDEHEDERYGVRHEADDQKAEQQLRHPSHSVNDSPCFGRTTSGTPVSRSSSAIAAVCPSSP